MGWEFRMFIKVDPELELPCAEFFCLILNF